jgi:hypothetical protein
MVGYRTPDELAKSAAEEDWGNTVAALPWKTLHFSFPQPRTAAVLDFKVLFSKPQTQEMSYYSLD